MIYKKIIQLYTSIFIQKNQNVFVQNKCDKLYLTSNIKLIILNYLYYGSGINTDQFKPKFIFNQKCKTFLVVARLIKEKGIYEYFEAVKMVKKKIHHWIFF